MLWEHVPNAWNAHISSNDAETAHQLWKLVKDRREALLASTASKTSDIAKLIQTEVNRQLFIRDKYKATGRSKARTIGVAELLSELPEGPDEGNGENEADFEVQLASARAPTSSASSTSFPYPWSNVKSRKKPPRPCRHCGNPLHYDPDCSSWKADKSKAKAAPKAKSETAYTAAWAAMTFDDEQAYNGHLDVYLAYTTDNTAVDTEVFTANKDRSGYVGEATALSWDDLPAYIAKTEDFKPPAEEAYEPNPVWDKLPGHAVRGIDAFKLLCSVNDPREEPAVVVGDSGAAPTLISEEFLGRLKRSKPRLRKGGRLNLLQLTGQAVCDHYICLDLWFRSQIGLVRLKGVEAYVVKGMKANLLIGEDTQSKWQFQTLRTNEGTCWQVGNSPHKIPSVTGAVTAESFAAEWAPEIENVPRKATLPASTRNARAEAKRRVVVARVQNETWINPESYAAVRCVARGKVPNSTWYLSARTLRLYSDALTKVPDGLVKLDEDETFTIYVTNTAKRRVRLRAGEVVGDLRDPKTELTSRDEIDSEQRRIFEAKVATVEGLRQAHEATGEGDFEHFGGPKTAQRARLSF
jgi:hypothetical protein